MTRQQASLLQARPQYVNGNDLILAAEQYVAAMGTQNARWLQKNLRHTTVDSDALRALNIVLAREVRGE